MKSQKERESKLNIPYAWSIVMLTAEIRRHMYMQVIIIIIIDLCAVRVVCVISANVSAMSLNVGKKMKNVKQHKHSIV